MAAEFFAVVLCRATGRVQRIINPDEDFQLCFHAVDATRELLVCERKSDFGISLKPDAMTHDNVQEIQRRFHARLDALPRSGYDASNPDIGNVLFDARRLEQRQQHD
jgi:hypothetical protein